MMQPRMISEPVSRGVPISLKASVSFAGIVMAVGIAENSIPDVLHLPLAKDASLHQAQ